MNFQKFEKSFKSSPPFPPTRFARTACVGPGAFMIIHHHKLMLVDLVCSGNIWGWSRHVLGRSLACFSYEKSHFMFFQKSFFWRPALHVIFIASVILLARRILVARSNPVAQRSEQAFGKRTQNDLLDPEITPNSYFDYTSSLVSTWFYPQGDRVPIFFQ